MSELKFRGWWDEREKPECPKPWETFTVCLHGEEAGDIADTAEDVNRILAASGYRLRLEKIVD